MIKGRSPEQKDLAFLGCSGATASKPRTHGVIQVVLIGFSNGLTKESNYIMPPPPLVSQGMGDEDTGLMGKSAVSLWDVAAQLERNRTACDWGAGGWGWGFPEGVRSDWRCGPSRRLGWCGAPQRSSRNCRTDESSSILVK